MRGPLLSQPALDLCLQKGVQMSVEEALAAPTNDGLPYAQPVSADEDAVWKPLETFTFDEARDLLARRATRLHEEHAQFLRLHRWCHHRFGSAPALAALGVGGDVDGWPEVP
jgi:hypothetical protein